MVNTAGYAAPGAALPVETLVAWLTPPTAVKVAPASVECSRPVSAASHTSPARPATVCSLTGPVAGTVAGDAVNVAPPSLLT
jgi:hypothetical protein